MILFGKNISFEEVDIYIDYINKIYLSKDLISLMGIRFVGDMDLFLKIYQYHLFNSMYEKDESLLIFNLSGNKLYWLYESSVVVRKWLRDGVDENYVWDSFILYWSWIVKPEFYNS